MKNHGTINKELVKWLALVVLPIFIGGAATLSHITDDGSIDDVMLALRKNNPVDEAVSEINGVIVAEPCRMTATTSQLRVCTAQGDFVNVVVPCPDGTLEKSGCTDGSEITCRGNNTFPGYMRSSLENVHLRPASSSAICPLSQAVKSGKVTCDLSGDGLRTSRCHLLLTNQTSETIKTCVPRGQTFKPSAPPVRTQNCQDMACVLDTVCTIPPNDSLNVQLPTMCISPKSFQPPPPPGTISYTPDVASPAERRSNDRLLSAAIVLHADHYYDDLPPQNDKLRATTIAQLARWIDQASVTNNPQDALSADTLRDEMVKLIPPSSLSKEHLKEVENGSRKMYRAAHATLKIAQSPKMDDLVAGVLIK